MSAPAYPHVIDNGAGERLTFLRRIGDRLDVENDVEPNGGPPMHVHHLQREALTVRQGRMGYQKIGEAPQFAGPGDEVIFEPGVAHRFWNAGSENLRCDGFIEPADNIEYFLSEVFAANARAGDPRKAMFDLAFLTRRYRSEVAMLEIPAFVQRVLFPVIVALGHLLGRYKRYANAPQPVVRA